MIMHIANLATLASIGVYEWERKKKQKIIINLRIEYDAAFAAESDRIEDALDYDGLEKRVLEKVQERHYNLLESMVNSIGVVVLEYALVREAVVHIAKPGALKHAETVSLEGRFTK
jgi:FolB domain-containing protein